MSELRQLLDECLNNGFISATISNPKEKNGITKIRIRPIMMDKKLIFQFESFKNNQAFHKNFNKVVAMDEICSYMNEFKQLQMDTEKYKISVLVSKKGKLTISKKAQNTSVKKPDLSHNRSKKYILQEGMKIPFLQDLGVMTADGRIVRTKMDKFRQINRFLEFVEDILPQLPSDRELTILDFGCGKSYLTFAIYYYLHELKSLDVRIIGLDLKSEVIKHCNELSKKYRYEKLKFLEGDIAKYTGVDAVDMVVTLHACDTATDFALYKAIGWNAKVILSVPCCQHELNAQITNELLLPVFKYGLIKERMAALLTDAMRGNYLESMGYDVQLLEFIDMEHTPKNILIRAVKHGRKMRSTDNIKKLEDFFGISPTLGRLLNFDSEKIDK